MCCKTWILSLLLTSLSVNSVYSQTFITSCQDLTPFGATGDQFCTAACAPGTTPTCSTPDGICQCMNPTCGASNPAFNTQLCPAPPPTPPIDPMANAGCSAACADPSICPNSDGVGMICGVPTPLDPAGTTFAAICTCYCPPMPCTTTTPSSTSIALLPNPLKPLVLAAGIKKKKIKWKVLLAYGLKWAILLAKLVGLTLLKLLLACLYFYATNDPTAMAMEDHGWSSLMNKQG